jgi:3-hydroxyisobutyrate dehydrogenase-like beta-hydroxyacid dehydrogenase
MADSAESSHVCVIGLGDMGSALAEALVNNGQRVTVWNRTTSRCDPLAEAGASVANSVLKATDEARIAVVCVLNHDVTVSLLMADDVAHTLRGNLLVQLSTVTAEESRALGHWAGENGIEYLDGAILGYRQDILRNQCPIVYSGSKTVFDAYENVLMAMGGIPRFVNDTIGSAPIFDKTFISFHYGSLLAFFHGAALCHAAGFSIELYAELMLGKTGENTKGAQERYGAMIAKRSYDTELLDVDMLAYEHVTRLSEELGIDTMFPETVAKHFERAIAEGHGQQTVAGIFELMVQRVARTKD